MCCISETEMRMKIFPDVQNSEPDFSSLAAFLIFTQACCSLCTVRLVHQVSSSKLPVNRAHADLSVDWTVNWLELQVLGAFQLSVTNQLILHSSQSSRQGTLRLLKSHCSHLCVIDLFLK